MDYHSAYSQVWAHIHNGDYPRASECIAVLVRCAAAWLEAQNYNEAFSLLELFIGFAGWCTQLNCQSFHTDLYTLFINYTNLLLLTKQSQSLKELMGLLRECGCLRVSISTGAPNRLSRDTVFSDPQLVLIRNMESRNLNVELRDELVSYGYNEEDSTFMAKGTKNYKEAAAKLLKSRAKTD